MEQDKEFSDCVSDLLNFKHQHESKAKGIDKFFRSLQQIKRKQDLVAPHPGVGLDCITLINHTQNQMAVGVGGRKDLVHELKTKGPRNKEN